MRHSRIQFTGTLCRVGQACPPYAKDVIMYSRTGLVLISLVLAAGCGSKEAEDRTFFTSGNREADQRAEQRISKDQQLRGEGEGKTGLAEAVGGKPAAKPALYERLGGEKGIAAIVDDFVTRALADPRVNWERKGVESGGFLGVREKSMYWNPTGDNVAKLKKHLGQFLALATGGPPTYEGKEMKAAHAGMTITNPEFDASIGDLKATLDKLGVAVDEQKELLAVVESTRPQVVEKR
jgi:hemoglobin